MSDTRRQILWASGTRLLPHTCRHFAESESLGESCPRLALCLQNLHPSVPMVLLRFLLQPDGSSQVPFATANLKDIYGVSPQEARADSTPLFLRIHTQDFDRVVDSIAFAARTQDPWLHEYRILPQPHGEQRWLRSCLVPHRDDTGNAVGYGVLADITAEKNSWGELRAVCDLGLLGVFRTTAQGRYLSVNAGYARLLGYGSVEEFMAVANTLPGQGCMHPEELACLVRMLETQGALQRYALEMRGKSGESVWLSMNVRALRDAKGRIDCCEGYCADITDQMRQDLQRGMCSEFSRTIIGEQRAGDGAGAAKPVGECSDGLCHLLSYVRDSILWRLRLPGRV